MKYEDFKEQFVQAVKDKLADAGETVKISLNEVQKINESYESMTITPKDANIGVNVNIEKFHEAHEDGQPFDKIVDKAVEVIHQGLEQKPKFEVEALTDYSQMKDMLVMEIVSAESNKEMLETIPHQNIEDMAVVYRFMLNSDENGRATVLVTNNMLETMGVTPEQLHADAMENAPRLKPMEIKGMNEVLVEIVGVEQATMLGVYPIEPEEERMYVASVPDKIQGAGVLAYQDFMDKAAERAGGDFFLIPSSIHELLIVPDNGQTTPMNLKELEAMVKEINETQVAPADRLTDSVYHYDSKEKIFELGEKYVERQSQKEASAERSEKTSVRGELKAKKEEAAKAPKKEPAAKAKVKGDEAI